MSFLVDRVFFIMNIPPILSICIPTYNRADCLEQILEKMMPVCIENNIHIYISDNASTDNTEKVGMQFELKYDVVHYYRHAENIGPDDNFEYVLKMSNTQYRWLMSDTCYVDNIDDLMTDLASADWDGYILGSPGDRGEKLPKEKRIYQESISLMNDIGWHLTWISCMIYHQRLIDSFSFPRYRNSCFNQTALMFEPTANRKCNICFNPIEVKNLSYEKDSGWHYHVFDVMYKQWYLLVMSLPLYYPYEVKKKCISDSISKALPLQFYFHARRRKEGKWGVHDVINNSFFIKQSCGHFFLLLMLGICPKFLVAFVFELGHYYNNMLRMIGIKK